MTTESWSTLQEVAKHLQVSEETIHRWMDKWSLPAHRVGRVWRFKLSEVDDWIRSGGAADKEDGAES
jgi:excisionase family DNA binding protein